MGKRDALTDAWMKDATAMGGVPTFLADTVAPPPKGAVRFEVNGFVFPGFVAGECGHRVAESEWRAGYRKCERC